MDPGSAPWSNRARGYRQKLRHRKFPLNMRKNFFTMQSLSMGMDHPERV